MTNLYLIKINNETEDFYKIGVSVHKYCRFYQIMKYGYSVEIIYMALKLDFYKAYDGETYLHGLYEDYTPKIKFPGYTECFKNINLQDYISNLNDFVKCDYEYIKNLKITWR